MSDRLSEDNSTQENQFYVGVGETDIANNTAVDRGDGRNSLTKRVNFTIDTEGFHEDDYRHESFMERRHDMENDEASHLSHNFCPHQLFVELYDLHFDEKGDSEWQETARWIKYEEDAEGKDHHWGRPHVAFLSCHALIQLRTCLNNGVFLMDVAAENYTQASEKIAAALKSAFDLDDDRMNAVLSTLQQKRKHVPESHVLPRVASISRRLSKADFREVQSYPSIGTPMVRKSFPMTECEESINTQGSKLTRVDELRTAEGVPPRWSLPENLPPDAGSDKPATPSVHDAAPRRKRSLFAKSSSAIFIEKEIDELMRKIPAGAEAAQVFVGVLPKLQDTRFAMVRLKYAAYMPELLEAPIPIRFLFLIVGPAQIDVDYHELGRSIATLMSNKQFHEIAYKAQNRAEIVSAVDDFLEESIVIPPGEVDRKQLLSPEEIKKIIRKRRSTRSSLIRNFSEESEESDTSQKPLLPSAKPRRKRRKTRVDPLKRTGKLFGGLVEDIKWRLPYYYSDFRDALNTKCLTSIIFMFFAAFAPAITFGGLLGKYTNESMGIAETLLAQCLCGVLWGFFSAQPLMVMSATGPVLIFEASLYTFCTSLELDFLTVRVWAGLWLVLIALLTVMFEGSFLVRYVTRFAEDIFSTLISVIFIAESVKFISHTFQNHPVRKLQHYVSRQASCFAATTEHSAFYNNSTLNHSIALEILGQHSIDETGEFFKVCGDLNQPDTGLLTAILLVATFVLAWFFKKLRSSHYFGRTLRNYIGDFGVLLSIVVVGLCDAFIFPDPFVTRLDMPARFGFTNMAKRSGYIFIPFGLPSEKWFGYLFALVPALLVYILLFVETEITELLLTKKERGLRKGSGYHWDLMLLALLTLLCSLLGLPWMCAAAVQSLAHAASLSVMKSHAPGERPHVHHVIEQRVTTICVALLVGACAFAGSILSHLPMAVLFGVFLYLGVMNLLPIQLIHRMVLFLIPQKYFPDAAYCNSEKVSMSRMHLYTLIQLLCLVIVYLVKQFKQTSLAFPFVIMLIAVVRILLLPRIFTTDELEALDGHEEAHDEDDSETEDFPYEIF